MDFVLFICRSNLNTFFKILLVLKHHLFPFSLIYALFFQEALAASIHLVDSVLMLIRQMGHLLGENFYLHSVVLFHDLHLSIKVFYLGFSLFDFLTSICVHIMYEILLHLQHVSLNLGINQLFL